MYKTFINTFKVSSVKRVNIFIYFLKKLPFIGKKISNNLYKCIKFKEAIGIITVLLEILLSFLGKALYLGFFMVAPIILLSKFIGDNNLSINSENVLNMMGVSNLPLNIKDTFLNIFFWLSFIYGSIMNISSLSPSSEGYDMIKLMRVNARDYYLSYFISDLIKNLVFFSPFMLFVFGVKEGLMFLILLLCFRIFGAFLSLVLFKNFKRILLGNLKVNFTLLVICLLLAYGLPIIKININWSLILFNPVVFIILLILGILTFLYLWKYTEFTLLSRKLLTIENVTLSDVTKANIHFSDVQINEKKIDKRTLNSEKFNDKLGYDYLNSLFFYRHKEVARQAIKTYVIIISLFFIAFTAFALFNKDIGLKLTEPLLRSTPALVFIMYSFSTTQRICKSLFLNCDMYLLKYGYYREGKVILENFILRLKKITMYNLIPALVICAGYIIIFIVGGRGHELIKLVPVCLCILTLSCFFSVYNLFMYYICQPYTEDLNVKSPFFSLGNIAIYFICFFCLQISTSTVYFTLGVIAITIIFIIVALALIYKLAPKTFRLK